MAVARLVDLGVTKVWWVTSMGIAGQPTSAEITGGKDLTSFLLPDFTFTADSSTTINERAINAVVDSETPTIGKVKGSLDLFRFFDSTTKLPDATDLEATFVNLPYGWLVRRIGLPSTTAAASGQKVDLANFIADVPQKAGGQGTGFLKLTVPLLSQGQYFSTFTLIS
jgi:hypothetical protein